MCIFHSIYNSEKHVDYFFLIYQVGVLCFSFGTLGLITGVYSIINAVFNIVVYKMRPDIRAVHTYQYADGVKYYVISIGETLEHFHLCFFQFLDAETQKLRIEAAHSDENESISGTVSVYLVK